MGNWTTVNIHGQCSSEDLAELKAFVNSNDFHCLCNTSGLCGLGDWSGEQINATGNLSERGYSIDDIVETIKPLAENCPSLKLKIHVGGDYESLECVGTVSVSHGDVSKGEPEIETLSGISEDAMLGRLFKAMQA